MRAVGSFWVSNNYPLEGKGNEMKILLRNFTARRIQCETHSRIVHNYDINIDRLERECRKGT